VAIGLFQLETHTRDQHLERFSSRTRQIVNGMPEDAVIAAVGAPPDERIDLRLDKENYDECRKSGAPTVLSYRVDHVGWFKAFGITTGWDEFSVCLNQEGRVIQTKYNTMRARGPQPRDLGTLALGSAIIGAGRCTRQRISSRS